jgi:NAD-dependent deacetylase
MPLELRRSERLFVLTGAGISAESGIPTFRGQDGLWEGHRLEDVATPLAFTRDPEPVWRFYSMRRAVALDSKPNAGHFALARLVEKLGERMLTRSAGGGDMR